MFTARVATILEDTVNYSLECGLDFSLGLRSRSLLSTCRQISFPQSLLLC